MNYISQEIYHRIIKEVPIACVDITIVVEGAVLLVKRKDPPAKGDWWVPGGRVHKGELLKEAAKRKAWEEVGIRCHVGPIVHTAETIFPDGPGDIPIHSINSCFFMYPVESDSKIRLDDHHAQWKWVKEIPKGLHPYVERCLMGAGLPEKITTSVMSHL